MRFIALDFETMNYSKDSICEIGCAEIIDGTITRDKPINIRVCPPTSVEEYRCVSVHGIHYYQVANEEKFDHWWNRIHKWITKEPDTVLLVHNIGMERTCINKCSETFGTPNDYLYIDTQQLCRHYFPNRKWSLENLCENVGIKFDGRHHCAGDDAMNTAKAFNALIKEFGISEYQLRRFIRRKYD